MIELICGMIAALIAYSFNGLLFKWRGEKSIVFFVPFVEEIAKTLIAFLIGGNLIGVHLIFGMIEALYDWAYTKNENAAWLAAVISIASHSIFGMTTYYLYLWTRKLFLGIVIVGIVHSLWNYFVTR